MNAPCVGASIERSARADPSSVGSAHKADRETSRIGKLSPGVARDAGRDARAMRTADGECVGSVVGGCHVQWVGARPLVSRGGNGAGRTLTGRVSSSWVVVWLWGPVGVCDTCVCVAGLSLADGSLCKWCVFIICRNIVIHNIGVIIVLRVATSITICSLLRAYRSLLLSFLNVGWTLQLTRHSGGDTNTEGRTRAVKVFVFGALVRA
jgi:hypothetical protein